MPLSATHSIPHPVNSEPASALDMPVSALAGVGPKVAEQLAQLGIARIFDLLLHLPNEKNLVLLKRLLHLFLTQ